MALVKINLLNHTDYYAAFLRDKDFCGLVDFYGAIESVRKENREHTLLLDAGDNFKHLLWDEDVTDGVEIIGTDVYSYGNHDFDKGKEHIERFTNNLLGKVEVICSNVVEKETGNLVKGAKPYAIVDKGGIKVGVLGIITEYTPYMVTKKYFAPYKVLDSVDVIRKYVPEMRENGAEVIVLLTHFPFYFTEDSNSGELFEVLEKVKDLNIDAIIGGHIPGDYAKVVDNVAVSKAGFGGRSLANIILTFDTETRKVVDKDAEIIDVYHNQYPQDERLVAFVKKVCDPYDYYYNEPIGEVTENIPMRLDFESPMGDLLADMLIWKFNSDIVYFNNTSCGRNLEAGKMTRAKVSDITHFNDPLWQSKYTGKMIWDLFETVHKPEVFGNNGNISFAGMKVEMDHTKPSGSKVISITMAGGSPIDFNKEYTVTTSEYMSSGGNGTFEITSQVEWTDTGIMMFDALTEYVIEHKKLSCPTLGRYPFIGKPENDNSPW